MFWKPSKKVQELVPKEGDKIHARLNEETLLSDKGEELELILQGDEVEGSGDLGMFGKERDSIPLVPENVPEECRETFEEVYGREPMGSKELFKSFFLGFRGNIFGVDATAYYIREGELYIK